MIPPQAHAALAEAISRLPSDGTLVDGRAPPGHPFFGALFLFAGALLVVELLAGDVWQRNPARRLAWPLTLFALGLGMLIVTVVQTTEKSLHFALAILLILGAVFEGRYRLGQITRPAADAFAIPALIVGGFVIGPMHANGTLLYDAAANTHFTVGLVGWALAAIKLLQMRLRDPAGLDYSFAFGVMALGVSLLLIEQFHPTH